jgi:mono/diheme cytochrome c family protein
VSARGGIGALLLAGVVGVAPALVATGCGGDQASPVRASTVAAPRHDRFDYARGLFRQLCGGCHTLADAGTHGKRKDLEESGVATIVHTRRAKVALARYAILYGEGSTGWRGAMPAWRGVLSDRQVQALSTYLGTVVGEGGRR